MKTYGKVKYAKSIIKRNVSPNAEPIETKIERITNNKEPITDGAPIIYTERKEGINSAYNIRTDRFEIAAEAMDAVTKTEVGKRMNRIKEREPKVIDLKADGKAEPTGGTSEV